MIAGYWQARNLTAKLQALSFDRYTMALEHGGSLFVCVSCQRVTPVKLKKILLASFKTDFLRTSRNTQKGSHSFVNVSVIKPFNFALSKHRQFVERIVHAQPKAIKIEHSIGRVK